LRRLASAAAEAGRAAILVAVGVAATGCSGQPTPEVMAGVDVCARCNMISDRVDQAAGLIMESSFVPFDSPTCMLMTFDERRRTADGVPAAAYLAEYGSGTFHRADSTWFVLTDRVPTVMASRALCFGGVEAARHFAASGDTVTDWRGFRLARSAPDRRVVVTIGPEGMEPPLVEASKGELVELEIHSAASGTEALELTIRGYEDAGSIRVPPGGGVATFRFFASRPGAGFPVGRSGGGATLGTVRVSGAHTPDEEVQ